MLGNNMLAKPGYGYKVLGRNMREERLVFSEKEIPVGWRDMRDRGTESFLDRAGESWALAVH